MNNVIESTGELKLIRVNKADFFKEVCIEVKLPKEMEERHELSDYDISVRFHNEGEIDVFVYDNKEDETKNIRFKEEVRCELIDFAKKQMCSI